MHSGLTFFLATPLLCAAQISGIVHDPSSARIAHATVELTPSAGTPR